MNRHDQVNQIIENWRQPTSQNSTEHGENLTNALNKSTKPNQARPQWAISMHRIKKNSMTQINKSEETIAYYEIMKHIHMHIPVILLEKSSHQSKGRGWDSGEVAKPFSSTFASAFLFLLSPLLGSIRTQRPRWIKAWEEPKTSTSTRIEQMDGRVEGGGCCRRGARVFVLLFGSSEHAMRFRRNERWREDFVKGFGMNFPPSGVVTMGLLFIYTNGASWVEQVMDSPPLFTLFPCFLVLIFIWKGKKFCFLF